MSANLIGQTLLKQFRIDAFIAAGGMGAVYRVWDLQRNVPLAMKVLHADLADDPSVFKLFQREARALQRLTHPNIVPFYGLYQTDDFTFLLEQFVDGLSLKTVLQRQHSQVLPVKEALAYLKALCAALGYAHSHGVVHCDVKPGNVMVDRGGNIYLTDFGIARHAESTTTTIGVAGAPAYMAPEQIRGEPVISETDIYALGITMFEMLTGHRPFRGTESALESSGATAGERVRYAHLHLAPPDPRNLNPNIPEALAQVILKALNKQPGARYRSTNKLFAAACAAAGVNPAQVPNRVAPSLQTWTPAETIREGASQPKSLEASAVGSRSSTLRQVFPWLAGATGVFLLGGLAIVILIIVILVTRGPSSTSTSVPGGMNITEAPPGVAIDAGKPPSDTPAQTVPTYPAVEALPPTDKPQPQPTQRRLPTPTKPKLPSPVPYKPPTIYVDKNAVCRGGPGSDYVDVRYFTPGTVLEIIGTNTDRNWWLVKINDPSTRKIKCWLGVGIPQGDLSSVPYSDWTGDGYGP